jgi:hypothetical protein
VVTEPDWLWLELLDELLPESVDELPESLLVELPASPVVELSSVLELELLVPLSSVWLCVPVDPDEPEVVAAVVELPPLPRAATASQAATKVASTPAATRRRRMRRRRLMGEVGRCMSSMVRRQPWILLGIRSGSGKSLRLLFAAS